MPPFDETIPGQKRKTLAQIIAERAGGSGQPFNIPQLSTVSPSPVQSSPDFTGPSQITPLQRQENQLRQMDTPPTRKQSLLQAVAAAAPIAIGGIFGGSVGASGAAQGVNEAIGESKARQDLKRKTLAQEVEAEKNRQERMGERELTAQTAANAQSENVRQHNLEDAQKRAAIEGENTRAANALSAENTRAANSLAETVRYHDAELAKPVSVSPGASLVTPGASTPLYTQPTKPAEQIPGRDIPLPKDVEDQRIRISLAEKAAAESGDINSLADMVVANPDLLKSLNPTLSGKVLSAVAKSGRTIQPAKQGVVNDMVDKGLSTIKYLKDNMSATGGGYGAVGAKGPSSLFGILSEPLPGTAARDYRSYIDALKSQVTLPNLDVLRGLGRVTDREFKALADAMTALNPSMSESQFMKELGTIETNLNAIKTRGENAAAAPSPATGKGPSVGAVVTVKGKRIKVTAVHPDGTFDGSPVQ